MPRRAAVDPVDEADEPFDLRNFGRSVAWAGLAFVAMLSAFVAARSEIGLRRINEAINYATSSTMVAEAPRSNAIDHPPARSDAEARRLAALVQTLSADRDRVLARLAALERSVDVTGSLPPPARKSPARETPAASPEPAGGPVVASVTLVPPGAPSSADIFGASGGMAPAIGPTTFEPAGPSSRVRANSVAESVVTHTQFGIDLGSEPDIEALRTLWESLKKQHGALLEGLRPVVAARETDRHGVIALHLVAGPLDNAATAARLCAALAASGNSCRPSTFDGQRLALR